MAGLFPLSIVLVQIATGSIGRFGVSRGLTRVSGLYHDIVSTRSYFVLTFIGILLYWRYFLKKTDKMRKIGLIILFSLLIIALFHQYSKTIIATGVIWAILFLFYERRVHIVALFLGGFLILNAFSNNKISSDIQQVFSKEVELVAGRSENTNVLAGRIMMWGSYMRYWHGLSIIEKLIGPGIAERPFHNDYIRILFNGGVIFLAVSVLIMFVFLVKINKNYARSGKFIHFIALISLAYFFVESVGATPGMYLNIQAIVWGLVGLSMNPEFRWQEA